MEALILIIVLAVVALIIFGLKKPLLAICFFIFMWIKPIWPFLLGCLIGIPLWLTQRQGLGNLLVIAGLIGNLIWWKIMPKDKKR